MTKPRNPSPADLAVMEPASWPYLLSLEEVAAILRCCGKTVRRLIDKGKLRAIRTGSLLRVRRPDLQAHLDANSIGSGVPQGVPPSSRC